MCPIYEPRKLEATQRQMAELQKEYQQVIMTPSFRVPKEHISDVSLQSTVCRVEGSADSLAQENELLRQQQRILREVCVRKTTPVLETDERKKEMAMGGKRRGSDGEKRAGCGWVEGSQKWLSRGGYEDR